MINRIENTEAHNPFYIRTLIPKISYFIGFTTFVCTVMLTESVFPAIVAYMIFATFLDQYLFYVKKMKSSDYAQADRLLAENEASLEQLDQYSAYRRNLRLISCCVGLITSLVSLFVLPEWFLAAFCLGYLATTQAGISVSTIDIKNKYPPAFKRDDRYYRPGQATAGSVGVNMYVAGRSSGITYGPIDTNN
jgi:hypothetical protein